MKVLYTCSSPFPDKMLLSKRPFRMHLNLSLLQMPPSRFPILNSLPPPAHGAMQMTTMPEIFYARNDGSTNHGYLCHVFMTRSACGRE